MAPHFAVGSGAVTQAAAGLRLVSPTATATAARPPATGRSWRSRRREDDGLPRRGQRRGERADGARHGLEVGVMENTRGNWAFEKSPQSTTSMAWPMPRNMRTIDHGRDCGLLFSGVAISGSSSRPVAAPVVLVVLGAGVAGGATVSPSSSPQLLVFRSWSAFRLSRAACRSACGVGFASEGADSGEESPAESSVSCCGDP